MNKLVQLGLNPSIIPSFGCRYTKPSPSYKAKLEMWKGGKKKKKKKKKRKGRKGKGKKAKAKEKRKRRMTRQYDSDRWQQWDLGPTVVGSVFFFAGARGNMSNQRRAGTLL